MPTAVKALFNPLVYLNRIEYMLMSRALNEAALLQQEREKFASFGWDYGTALSTLNRCLEQCGMARFGENRAMESTHWLLFAAISTTEKVQRVLEIGTYTAQATRVLRGLFPDAYILTIDVPDSDPIMRNTYGRVHDEAYQAFLAERTANLKCSNATFLESNSFFLPEHTADKFDLIWVDGGHRYPEIAWDICNSFHLCNEGGYILIDDVLVHPDSMETDKVSRASFEIIQYILERRHARHRFFLKRVHPIPRYRKYVAVLQKE